MKWWFSRLPRAEGSNGTSGRLNDWWEYVFNFNAYDDRGGPIRVTQPGGGRATRGTETPKPCSK
jgi:hypothetical protein